MNNFAYLGVVRGGAFHALAAEDGAEGSFRLTTVAPHGARPAESGEIPLHSYDQRAIFVRGIAGDGWIYGASVVDAATEILTLVVTALFSGGRVDPLKLTFPGG